MNIRIRFDKRCYDWNNTGDLNTVYIHIMMDHVTNEIIIHGRPITVKDIKTLLGFPDDRITLSDYVYWLKPEALVNGHIDYEIVSDEGPNIEVIIHGIEMIDISKIDSLND